MDWPALACLLSRKRKVVRPAKQPRERKRRLLSEERRASRRQPVAGAVGDRRSPPQGCGHPRYRASHSQPPNSTHSLLVCRIRGLIAQNDPLALSSIDATAAFECHQGFSHKNAASLREAAPSCHCFQQGNSCYSAFIASTEICTETSSPTYGANLPRPKSDRTSVVVASKPAQGLPAIG